MRTSFKYFIFICLFAVLGFSREFIFVNINSKLYSLYYHHSLYQLPKSLSFLNGLDYDSLYFLKFPFTVICFSSYLLLSLLAVKYITTKKNALWVIFIYTLLLVLSGLAMGFNYLYNHQLDGSEYTFSRWLMGIAQSPLVAFFVIASSKLYNTFETEQKL